LPSRRSAWTWLLAKEGRELAASRAWWVMLLVIGPLVGFAFIGAVRTYAEASGLHGTAAGVGEAFSPLVGIWAPTFSACELAAAFLLPFVAIRLVGGDRQSGALKLELQHPMPAAARIGAKALILVIGWVVASLAPAIGVALWKAYGGSVYLPELVTVALGHMINAALTIALAAAAASIAEHPSTAAIVTLSMTVGTWIVNFIAAVEGGLWTRLARYTPTSMVAEFQRGLIRLDIVFAAVVLVATGLLIAAIWMRLGVAVRRRAAESSALLCAAAVALASCMFVTTSWDMSESRRNSFARADESALARIGVPITIEVHLAPEDPRRVDFETRALSKLRRVRPDTRVRYVSATSIGLFEQTSASYGEIWYDVGGYHAVTRSTTAESLLETIYSLAGVAGPMEEEASVFRGHPLPAQPTGARAIFYVLWPAAVGAAALLAWRPPSPQPRRASR
jgi:ABC-2 type transport system permease protein